MDDCLICLCFRQRHGVKIFSSNDILQFQFCYLHTLVRHCPVRQCPVLQCPVLQCPVRQCPSAIVQSCNVHPCEVVRQCPVLQSLVLQCPAREVVRQCPVLQCPVRQCPVLHCPVLQCQARFFYSSVNVQSCNFSQPMTNTGNRRTTCNFCSDYVAIQCFCNVCQVYSLQAVVISSPLDGLFKDVITV